ncbi:MAG: RidA family protein [Bacteroidales bacterium]|nr:RidA family protein [Bacteroidales bacterium]
MKIISSESIPPANGHYSPCIEHNGTLYISGQLPVDPATKQIPAGIEAQTKLVLEKIGLILTEAGSSREKVIQMRIYISDIALWNQVNEVYTQFFGAHKPVRCVVPVGKLHYGCLIEAECVAGV